MLLHTIEQNNHSGVRTGIKVLLSQDSMVVDRGYPVDCRHCSSLTYINLELYRTQGSSFKPKV